MALRELNEFGTQCFQRYLDELRKGSDLTMTAEEILGREATTEATEFSDKLNTAPFASRYEMGCYLVDIFSGQQVSALISRDGLWNWIALTWLDQLKGGKLREDHNYIIGDQYSRAMRYRHSVFMSWWLVKKYGETAKYLLSKPANVRGEVTEQLLSVQYYISCAGFINAGEQLYWDREACELKKGAGGKGAGSSRRFMAWIAQIELNYDLFEISTQTLMDLLPAEFDRFKPA